MQKPCASKIYPATFAVAALFSAAMMATVTYTVFVESSGVPLEREPDLERIAVQVQGTISPAILLNCLALFLQFFFLKRERDSLGRAAGYVIWTYMLSFLVWLSYAMFYVLAGQYLWFPVFLILLTPMYLLVVGVLFLRRSQAAAKQNTGL